jgi:hypothetical protein
MGVFPSLLKLCILSIFFHRLETQVNGLRASPIVTSVLKLEQRLDWTQVLNPHLSVSIPGEIHYSCRTELALLAFYESSVHDTD